MKATTQIIRTFDAPQLEKVMISNLLNEIQDGSLQTILRRFIFQQRIPLEAIIRHARPEYTQANLQKLKETV